MIHVRPVEEDDGAAVAGLRAEAFNDPARTRHAPPTSWVGCLDGEVVATLDARPTAQYLGGRPVPTAAISGVVVAPKARGRGMSGRLLTEVHAQLASAGIALATLWPSSIAPYARVGYAPAGQRLRHSLPLAHLPQRGGDDVVRETEPTDALASCYESFARANSGMFARGPSDWRRLMTGTDTSPVQVWSARRAGAVVGYVVLTQETASGPMPFTWSQRDGHYNYDLICRDLVWSDAEAARSLLGFLAGFAPMAQVVHWTGPMHDPLVTLLRGQQPAVSSAYRWMSCLLDVPVALRARGWPADATCDVVLTVQGQSQQYGLRLRVAGGDAVVDEVPTGTTAVTVDAGALAALYTGWLSPADAVRTGQLRGTTPKDVSSLTACLAGPSPWTLDFF